MFTNELFWKISFFGKESLHRKFYTAICFFIPYIKLPGTDCNWLPYFTSLLQITEYLP